VCLAIPGHIVELVERTNGQLAVVDVLGVRRNINVGLLEEDGPAAPGDWILIHMGFALSKVSEAEAAACLSGLQMMGNSGTVDKDEDVGPGGSHAVPGLELERRTA
jgi:hydrogenase expression/formation protein HypC